MRRTVALLGLVAFPPAYCGVWWLPAGWQQAACGVVALLGLLCGVGYILGADRRGETWGR
jgi:hypothetical protein